MNKISHVKTLILTLTLSVTFISVPAFAATCGGVETSIVNCDNGNPDTLGGVGALLTLGVRILTGLIGAGAIGAVVYAGILYTTAGGSSDQTKKAIGLIRNVIIGVLAYALMYFILNWLVPGGVPIL